MRKNNKAMTSLLDKLKNFKANLAILKWEGAKKVKPVHYETSF